MAASVKYSLLSSSYVLLLLESAVTPPSTAVITSCRSESVNEKDLVMLYTWEIKSCRDHISYLCHKRSYEGSQCQSQTWAIKAQTNSKDEQKYNQL